MKIAFICETLEPGRSGVGDYTWRLAGAVRALGHESWMLAFADRFVTDEIQSTRECVGQTLTATRFPVRANRSAVENWLADCQPGWTCLQFVPYSFHPKGLPDETRFPFSSHRGGRHHLMIHETWIGQHPGASLRHRVAGKLQRRCCLRAIRAWRPALLHTSCEIYQRTLERNGFRAGILPMFGTVESASGVERCLVACNLLQRLPLPQLREDRYRLAVVFGSLYDVTSFTRALRLLQAEASRRGLFLAVFLAGHPSLASEAVCTAVKAESASAAAIALGPADDATLSSWLRAMDFGLTATPLDGIGKSSAAATLRDQGLPVLACSRGAWKGESNPPFFYVDDFIRDGLVEQPPRYECRDRVLDAAKQLVQELEEATNCVA